ncbi:MAG: aminotransferase class I/II-fold pyridoxal phosphate-dependent enzyme [Methylococcaceae bacterium]|nr:aminotransferase class I/II-fold pyridoxal phosphate-dependent enzyme [Methylococcaceae bacterium]
MSRGKPSPEQLDLSLSMLNKTDISNQITSNGIDCRNYGIQLGLPEVRDFFSSLLEVPSNQVVVEGNSSLSLMHDAIVFALLHGTPDNPPWLSSKPITFLCPVPGYDRHFSILEAFGINMINVPLLEDGPDMDLVESLVSNDASIKGIWCVPKYNNPTGTIYSEETINRLASMNAAASDFRLFWDDAYRFHHLTEQRITIPNIIDLCQSAGHPDRAIVFASTSKMTFAGSGLAILASSLSNINWWEQCVSIRSIGPDKLNQLRHLHFFQNSVGIDNLMNQHRLILKPKFDAVDSIFEEYLGKLNNVSWSKPLGGYFINLITPTGLAKRTVELAKNAGIILTPAGATFPYGSDPDDKHIRIAPSYPTLDEIKLAAQGVSLALLHAINEQENQT